MFETLIGTALGGLFRLAPEVLKWLDRRGERAHERAMLDKQVELDTLHASSAQKLAEIEAGKALGVAELQALLEGVKAQGQLTGIGWVDGINSLMRPVITFWWVLVLYTVALGAQYLALVSNGEAAIEAILKLWGPEEKALVSSIVSFWFVDRSIRKGAFK